MPSSTLAKKPVRDRAIDAVNLTETPGHLLRRCQQRAVEIYAQEVGDAGLRPPQFAVVLTVHKKQGLNQTELVRLTGIDRSTIADMISRLVKRGLLTRTRTSDDQRANRLWITDAGVDALDATVAAMERAQERIMAPVPADRRAGCLELLKLLAELPDDDKA